MMLKPLLDIEQFIFHRWKT